MLMTLDNVTYLVNKLVDTYISTWKDFIKHQLC